nr:unnamed protein product [Callosobruchus chinensis]
MPGRHRSGVGYQCASSDLSHSTLGRNSGAAAAPDGKQPQVCTGTYCSHEL